MTCCPIFEVFDEEHLLIKEYKHWKVLAHTAPRTLGSCVVLTKSHHPRFGELSEEETAELAVVAKELEGALMQLWKFDNINWLMLMMKDKHTHFHVFPRYETDKEFEGKTFANDKHEMNPLKLSKLDLSLEEKQAVRDAIVQIIK